MEKELQHLESELKTLRPAAPSAALYARLQRDLDPLVLSEVPAVVVDGRAWPGWWWAAALPAAAAIVLVVGVKLRERSLAAPTREQPPAPAVAAGSVLKPVEAQNVLYAASDEGLVTLEDGTTARRERLQFVDTITWRNPRTKASLTWSVPREEIRVVPVSFH